MTGRKRPGRFDIELPAIEEGIVPEARRAKPDLRRGPMAAAVSETATSLEERAAAEAAIRAENDALAHEHVRLKEAGRVTDLIDLDLIDADRLTRDRVAGPDPDLQELVRSIREIGLSNPIRVAESGAGRYELVQGYRRLAAYRALLAETGDPVWSRIPAGLLPAQTDLAALYRRMVDENLVRSDLSFAEMAMLARAYAADPALEAGDLDTAVNILYASVRPQKRSYIRAFADLLDQLGGDLRYPQDLSRNLGLALRRRLETVPGLIDALRTALRDSPARDAAGERAILERFSSDGPSRAAPAPGTRTPAPKSVFRFSRPEGEAKCTAANGKVELRLARDFSALDRRRLERALGAFFTELDRDA